VNTAPQLKQTYETRPVPAPAARAADSSAEGISAPTPKHLGPETRVFGLDLLRCIAILIVMVGHGNYFMPESTGKIFGTFMPDGVQLFFVLSGFLIGGIFIRQFDASAQSNGASARTVGGAQILEFWKRRWFRTLPAYVLVILVVVVIRVLLDKRPAITTVAQHLTFTQNLTQPPPWWFYHESWSLAIEEWFYLLLPTAVLALVRLGMNVRQALCTFTLVTGMGAPILRLIIFLGADIRDADHFFAKTVPLRLDSIAYGVGGAYLLAYHQDFWSRMLARRTALFFLGIGCLLLVINLFNNLPAAYRYVLSWSLEGASTLLMLPFLSTLQARPSLIRRTVSHFAKISYSMYLLNYTLVANTLLSGFHPADGVMSWPQRIVAVLLFWTATIILASLLYQYWEKPTTKLREWQPRLHRVNPASHQGDPQGA
jgi:peptidoglycan/LPS O-acetylase OafA/YrhL